MCEGVLEDDKHEFWGQDGSGRVAAYVQEQEQVMRGS